MNDSLRLWLTLLLGLLVLDDVDELLASCSNRERRFLTACEASDSISERSILAKVKGSVTQ